MELTTEQHLNIVAVAVLNHEAKYDELVRIRESFNHITKLCTTSITVQDNKPETK